MEKTLRDIIATDDGEVDEIETTLFKIEKNSGLNSIKLPVENTQYYGEGNNSLLLEFLELPETDADAIHKMGFVVERLYTTISINFKKSMELKYVEQVRDLIKKCSFDIEEILNKPVEKTQWDI